MKFIKVKRTKSAIPTRVNLEEIVFYDVLRDGTIELVMSSGHKINAELTEDEIDMMVTLSVPVKS